MNTPLLTWNFLQVEYIWKGRKKSICKCGLHCIIVRCLTDRLFSHLPFPLCACHANFIHLPSPCLNNSFIRPHRRIVILRLWGSLLTSTVCRCYPTIRSFSIVWYAYPAYLSPVWTIDVSPRFFIAFLFWRYKKIPTRGPIKIAGYT